MIRRHTHVLAVLALIAAACQANAPAPEEADPFDGPGSLEQGVAVACTGNAGCTATGSDLSIYTATYRIGSSTTSRGEMVQTFKATASGYPDRVTLSLRHLRAFTLPQGADALLLHVGIFAATPRTIAYGPLDGFLAVGDVPLNTFSATGGTVPVTFPNGLANVPLEGTTPLEAGASYGVSIWTDGLGAGVTGTVMLGVGALVSTPYADGVAVRANARRTSPSANWGAVRFRPAGEWLLFVDVSTTTTCASCPGLPGAPGGVTAQAGNASAIVSWTAPASDGGAPIDRYTVTASPGNASVTTTNPATTLTFTGLTNGTPYTFGVIARNANGDGPASAPSAPVTPSPCATNNGGCSPFGTCTASGDTATCACPPLYDAVGSTCVRHSPIANGSFEGTGGWVKEGNTMICDMVGRSVTDDAVHGQSLIFMNNQNGCKNWQAAALDVSTHSSVRLRVDVRFSSNPRPIVVKVSTGSASPYDQVVVGSHTFTGGALSETAALQGTTTVPAGPWYAWTSVDLKPLLPANTQFLRIDLTPGSGGSYVWVDNVALVLDDANLPTLTATATPSTGHTPLPVNLAGSCADAGGSCAGSWWSIADGDPSAGWTITHTALSGANTLFPFTRTGATSISYTVQDDQGAAKTTFTTVTTSNAAPTAAVTASTPAGPAPLAVNFESHAADDFRVAAFAWDFGDGTTSTLANPSHTYAAPGTYRVSLTVTDDDGAAGSSQTWVVATGPATIANGAFEETGGWVREGNTMMCDMVGRQVSDDAVHGQSLIFMSSGSGCGMWQVAAVDADAHTSVRLRVDARQGYSGRPVSVRLSTGPTAPYNQQVIGTHVFAQGALAESAALTGTTTLPGGPWYAWTSNDLKPLLPAGTHFVRVDLIVTNGGQYAWLDNLRFVLDDATLPTGTLAATPTTGHTPLAVALSGTCVAGAGATCAGPFWSIATGSASEGWTMTHAAVAGASGNFTFTANGTTQLSYTVQDDLGGARTLYTSVTTSNLPPATSAVATPPTGAGPLAVTFASNATDDAGVASTAWTFGDGDTSTDANPTHTYAAPGTYRATVTVTDGDGASASSSAYVVVTGPVAVPNGDFESSGGWIKDGNTMMCDMVGRNVTDDALHGQSLIFMNSSSGCGTWQVAAVDADARASVRLRVDVRQGYNARPLGIRLSTGPSAPYNQQVIGTHTFAGGLLSESGALQATTTIPGGPWYAWTSDDLKPLLPAGTQFVRIDLIPSNNGSYVWLDNVSFVFDDAELPTQAFSANPSSGTAPLAITFTGACADLDGTCASGSWSFGDADPNAGWTMTNSAAAGYTATHTFATGSYVVSYTVVDDKGGARTAFTSVSTSNVPPTVSFTPDVTVGPSALVVNFTSTATDPDGSIASYSWSFGDGGTSTQANPTHTFVNQGTYVVTLTVADQLGAIASTNTVIVAQ